MKTLPCFAVMFLATAIGSGQVPPTTTSPFPGWTATGSIESELQGATLGGGAQLQRPTGTGAVTLKVVSQPRFTAEADECAILELGAVALLFSRNGDEGQIWFALGEEPLEALPFRIALDGDARAAEPVHVVMERTATTLRIGVNEESVTRPLPPESAGKPDAVLSAGRDNPWAVLELSLSEPVAEEATETVSTSAPQSSSADSSAAGSTGETKSGTAPAPSAPAASANPVQTPVPPDAKPTLEVFTPPAFRHSHMAALRAALQKATEHQP